MIVQRDGLFDCIKGGLILLVVLGHSVAYSFPDEYLTRWDFKVIYSFHMALFIFVSGYFVAASKKVHDWRWLRHRLCRLLLPYCVWSAIAKVFSLGLMYFFCAMYELDVYWFLIVLFLLDITYVFASFVNKQSYKFSLYSFSLLIVVCGIGGWIDSFWHIFKLYVLYMPFYFLGVFFFYYKEKVERILSSAAPLFVMIYIIMLRWFDVGTHPALYMCIQSWYPAVTRDVLEVLATIYNRIVLFFGMVSWYFFFQKVYSLTTRTGVGILGFLGKYTMPIYLMHSFFFVLKFFDGIVNVIWGTFLGIGGALFIYYLVKQYRWGRMFFFGES